jgi:large subunit ribosomal protein L19e
MNLSKKKALASRTLKVGKDRIVFVKERLDEIKEIITKQDVLDLKKDGAILIKPIKGRKKVRKRTRGEKTRSPGNVRKKQKLKRKKQDYVKLTRKLRSYLDELKKAGKISQEDIIELKKKIRNRIFKSKSSLREYLISNKILRTQGEGK